MRPLKMPAFLAISLFAFVHTGGGHNTITVGDGGVMDWIRPLTIDREGDNDTLTFDNHWESQGRHYTLIPSKSDPNPT